MNWHDFHFLRPLWLIALLPLLALLWHWWRVQPQANSWEKVCDPELLPHLLVGNSAEKSIWPGWLLAAGMVLAVLALAGPTWSKESLAAYRLQSTRVFVLDLSRSMDATDIKPSRLARAKFKLLDMLKRTHEGQAALVVFAQTPHVVTPMTRDTHTIANLVSALSTDLLGAQGSHTEHAIVRAASLIENSGLPQGDIILLTDGLDNRAATLEALHKVRENRKIRLSVLAIGSSEGAPIPLKTGEFVKDDRGAIVMPKTDFSALTELARSGGGIMTAITDDDRDIDALLAPQDNLSNTSVDESNEQHTDQWQDRGPWLLLLIVPLAAMGFRRGWLMALLFCISLPWPNDSDAADNNGSAFGWTDLWQRRDQQGAAALEQGELSKAATLFADPLWRGTALYRDKKYQEAAAEFAKINTPQAHYDRGNSLAQLGQYDEAIQAYDTALKQDPNFEDARFNRKLLEKQRQNNKSDKQSSPQQSEQKSNGQNEKSASNGKTASEAGNTGENKHGDTARRGGSQKDLQQQLADAARRAAADNQDSTSANKTQDSDTQKTDPGQSAAKSPDEKRVPDSDSSAQNTATAGDARSKMPAQEMNTPDGEGTKQKTEQQIANEQWLQRIPDDPGGLLRRKFLRDQQQQGTQPSNHEPQW